MLNTVTEIVNCVRASFRTNDAVPKDVARGVATPSSVGTVGGFSWEFVRLAVKMTSARPASGSARNATVSAVATRTRFIAGVSLVDDTSDALSSHKELSPLLRILFSPGGI